LQTIKKHRSDSLKSMKKTIAATIRRHLDQQIDAARPVAQISRPERGWVNAIRRALGMTEAQLAERMGITQSTLHRLESSEASGKIRLDSLRRAAEALGCEVAYVMIPRAGLEATVRARARDLARAELERVSHSMALEAQDVGVSEAALEERAREILTRGALWRSR
jgi:predicted DNA-binding mobile mystery protein A